MLERETSGNLPRVEVVYTTDQDGPFAVAKAGPQWQLLVNKSIFESKGFLPDEISGAVHLEEERLIKQTAATTKASVDGLRRWQDIGNTDPKIAAFKTAFERLTALTSLEEKDADKAKQARRYLEKIAARSPSSDYTDQLFGTLLRKGLAAEPPSASPIVETVANNLQREETVEGRSVSPLAALTSPDLSFASKASWFENRFLPRYEFLSNRSLSKKEVQQEEPQSSQTSPESAPQPEPTPPTPSSTQDEYEQHRGREEKGKGSPIFIIDPSFTGYWEEDSYDSINEQSGRLVKSSTQRIRTAISQVPQTVIESSKRTISGNSGDALFNLPLSPGFQLTQDGLTTLKSQQIGVFSDAEGHIFIQPTANAPVKIEIARGTGLPSIGINSRDDTISEQNLPSEISTELDRIRNLSADSLGKIQEWKDFVQRFFKYPPETQVQSMYSAVDGSPSRLEAMALGKMLDCYLAREFFVGGLKRLNLIGVEWRLVNGHYVASPQKDDTAHIHSGTGHAWLKLRLEGQKNWIIIDPTPPGDPIHEGEGAMEDSEELSPNPISNADLDEMEKEAEDSGPKKEIEQTQDHYLLDFATEAGISSEEAQQILNSLAKVDQLKDSQGRVIQARLKEQFDRVIQEYTVVRQGRSGLTEMSKGRALEDPVSAFIDVRAGNLDPTGFEKRRFIEEKEQYYSGWDLEVITDGSGSMNDALGGRKKYLVQRDMSYLLQRSMHRFSQEAERRKLRLATPIEIRSSQYMFRGNKIQEIKPLSGEFNPAQMATLWKESGENIGGGTPAHLGLQAVLDRIPPEEVQLLKDKKLLKVVALISDGGYDNSARVTQLINALREINVIVAEFPITDEKSLEELPQNVAEKVIEAARLLMPERVRK